MYNIREYMDDTLTEYLLSYYNNTVRLTILNILDILNDVNKYDSIEEELLSILDTEEEDDSVIVDRFNIELFKYLNEIINDYGIVLDIDDIVFKYHYYILNMFKEVFTYNEIMTDDVINILSSEDDSVMKISRIIEIYNDIDMYTMYDVIDSVNENMVEDMSKSLNKLAEEQNDDIDDVEDMIKNKELVGAYMYKYIMSNDDIEQVRYEDYVEELYGYITTDISIEEKAKNIYVVLKLDNGIDDKMYYYNKNIEEDLLELSLSLEEVSEISKIVQKYITGNNND